LQIYEKRACQVQVKQGLFINRNHPQWFKYSIFATMRIAVILFLISFFPFCGYSQDSIRTKTSDPIPHQSARMPVKTMADNSSVPDTILLNNGKIIITKVIDTTSPSVVTILRPNSRKQKKIDIDREEIFSITFANTGKEEVLYIYDTLVGHDFTVDEARKFIAGEQDARRGFHAVGVSIIAFTIGFSSGVVFGSEFSFGPPFFYAGIMTYPIIRVRHKSVRDLNNVKFDAYLYGYDQVARQKRTLHSFMWGGIGLVSGLITNLILLNNQ